MKHKSVMERKGDVLRVACDCGMLREYTRQADGTLKLTRFVPSPDDSYAHSASDGGVEMGACEIGPQAGAPDGPDDRSDLSDPYLGPWEEALRRITGE